MSYDLTNVVAKPDVTALQMGVPVPGPSPDTVSCQLSVWCCVLADINIADITLVITIIHFPLPRVNTGE